jgi:hypothetical protein
MRNGRSKRILIKTESLTSLKFVNGDSEAVKEKVIAVLLRIRLQ